MLDIKITVVIPTYNRKDTLKKCLNAVFNQSYPKAGYEVIVIDDGSTDGTEGLVSSLLNDSPCTLRYFKQEHKGPAAARNVGIKSAYGKIILFIGDDIIATPTLLDEHIKWHKDYSNDNVAVLGYVTWSPEIKITPFMRWLEKSGVQFGYSLIEKYDDVPYNFFYTSNISMKRKFLLENNGFFDEEFPYAAYEDIELGYRLKKAGMILKYNNEAVGYHYHHTTLDDTCRRMIMVGESSQMLAKKLREEQNSSLPNISLLRKIVRRGRVVVRYLIARFYETRAIKGIIFDYVMRYYTNIGVRRYWNKRK
jgi:glycosyltransferase involved in cell wall biosynthesis